MVRLIYLVFPEHAARMTGDGALLVKQYGVYAVVADFHLNCTGRYIP